MNTPNRSLSTSYRDIVVRAWQDAAFKQQLLSDPKTVLSAAGITVPEAVTVHENSLSELHFVLPQAEEISDLPEVDPVVAQVIERATQDESFKQRLLAEPSSAVKEATGVDVQEGLNLHIYENSADHVHLIVPINPEASFNAELSDTELEAVL